MVLEIVKILLPIATALTVGVCSRKYQIIDSKALEQIKKLLFDLIIPITLFNTFLNADFSEKSLLFTFSTFFAFMIIYVLATYITKHSLKSKNDFFPEMVATWEGGTIGISLCSLLLGTYGLQQMAILDFGHAIFLFGFVVPILKIKDGAKIKPSEVIKLIFSSKPLLGIIFGVICGVLGIGRFINNIVITNVIYHGITDIIISPINFLILFMIGYMINIKKDIIGKIITICISRLFFMGLACFISCFIIFNLIPFDKEAFTIALIAFSLPPTYALGIFTNFKKSEKTEELYSDVVSFSTLVCLVLYAFISMYYFS